MSIRVSDLTAYTTVSGSDLILLTKDVGSGNYTSSKISAANFLASASYATSASFASNALTANSATSATTATNLANPGYNISVTFASQSNFAQSSSYASASVTAVSASYAANVGAGGLATGSTYPITSSWSTNTISASYWNSSSVATILNNKQNNLATGSTIPVTASFAVSASYAPGSTPSGLATGSTYPITASWASNAISSSFATNALTANGANTATTATSATTATIATTATNLANPGYNISVTFASQSNFAQSASFASSSVSSSYAATAATVTSASYATNALSASYAPSTPGTLGTGSTYPFTASFAVSASYAPGGALTPGTANYIPKWSGSTLSATSSIYDNGYLVVVGNTGSRSNTGRFAVKQNGIASHNVISFHQDNETPFLQAWFNDTFNGLTASFESYVDNTGNVFMGTPFTTSFRFYTNEQYNNPSFIMDGTGKVGIGTALPQTTLHVQGNISCSQLIGTATNAVTASYALNGGTGGGGLGTGSTYPFTSSWSTNALTASYITGSMTFNAGITYPLTASNAISASYAPGSTPSGLATGSTYPITSSYAVTASYAMNGGTGGGLGTGSTYPFTASFAVSASYAPGASIGTGTQNYVVKWLNTTTLSTSSSIFDNGTNTIVGSTAAVQNARFGVGQGSANVQNVVELHQSSSTPYLLSLYNDTFASNSASLNVSVANDGTNNIGTQYSNGSMHFYVGSVGSDEVIINQSGLSASNVITSGSIRFNNYQQAQGTLNSGSQVTLDFAGFTTANYFVGSGSTAFTSSNLAAGRTYRLFITGSSQNTTANSILSFPSWQFLTGAPTTFTANKVALLTLESWGTSDSQVLAWYQEVP